MQLRPDLHLAYCTNIHRGETWAECSESLQRFTLAVRERVCPTQPYAIGLRLSNQASRELSEPQTLRGFRAWLDRHGCYVFTINGFPYGQFHGTRVKEQVYRPDWTSPERLEYTNRLFNLLSILLPPGLEGSVSTVPGSFKEFIRNPEEEQLIRSHLWRCLEHVASLSHQTGKKLHLGLEPEPLGHLENSRETVEFFDRMRADRPDDPRLAEHLGITYDTCHLAVEFEEPETALATLLRHQVKISKIHLSTALKVDPTPEVRQSLTAFADSTYLHQVIERHPDGTLRRYRDLDDALHQSPALPGTARREWRIHFHIPLHSEPTALFQNTSDHLLGVLQFLRQHPALCPHLEMETYTWEVLPSHLRHRTVVDQLAAEYHWCLDHLRRRGLC